MATRKEEKEAARAERQRKQEEDARAAARRRRIGYIVGGVLAAAAIAAVVVVIASSGGDDDHIEGFTGDADAEAFPTRAEPLPDPPADLALESAAEEAGCTYSEEKSEGADHTESPVTYKAVPPHSGDHNPVAADDGPYTDPPDMVNLVHSLEHGRIVLWYTADTPENVRADLKAIYDEDPAHMIIAPIENMTAQAAATAWTQSLVCDEWNEDAINAMRAFRDSFRDQGPEFVP
jgi:hypothetical protein